MHYICYCYILYIKEKSKINKLKRRIQKINNKSIWKLTLCDDERLEEKKIVENISSAFKFL